ncbi:translocation/assembly module TamB domain-containing protein [Cetobacterium sp.]|uniref:translocation/assembly module TamB domain-containing protein n=1 Tax=Cetobacterium sp. TaxID=2071632 RepID=UPI002FC767CB
MKIFEKYKKLTIISLSFFILLSGGLLIKYELPKIVEIILKIAVGPTISIQEIKFPKFGEIDATGVVLSDKKKVIVQAPEVKIVYSKNSLKQFRLEEIHVNRPWVHIDRKNSNVNIVEAFSSGNSPSDSKAGIGVPIDKITVKNAKLLFTDKSYSREIVKNLADVNGFVSFNKETGIDLEFKGDSNKEKYEYRFNNLNEPLDMNIVLKNIQVTPELIQYGYDDPEISKASGLFNMDLTIATRGLIGEAELKNGNVIYDGLDGNIEDINGKIKFKTDKIFVNFDYLLDKNKGKFDVFYSEKDGVKVEFKFKDLPYTAAAKYKLLGDLKLPLENLKFSNVDVGLFYKKETGFKAVVDYKGEKFETLGLDINNLNGKVIFQDNILKLTGDDISLYIPGLDYEKKLSYETLLDLGSENLKFDVKTNYLDLKGIYEKKDGFLKLYQDSKLALSYNFNTKNLEIMDLKAKDIIGDYDFFIKAKGDKQTIKFEEISMVSLEGQKVFLVNGDLNTENLKYFFKIHSRNLREKNLFKKLNVESKLDFIGEIAGEKEKFILRGVAKDIRIENKDMLLDAYANISLLNDKELEAQINGELREVKYKKIKVQGIKINTTLKNKNLEISDLRNEIFKVSGQIDLEDKYLDLDYNISGLKSSEFQKTKIDLILDNVEGKVQGNFDNLVANANILEANLEMPNKQLLALKGKISYEDNIVLAQDFKVNQSLGKLKYDIKEKNGEFVLNILEENLPRYYNYNSLKYRLLSRVIGKISDGDISVKAGLNIDRVYLNGEQLPNLAGDIDYTKNNIENRINIPRLTLLGLDGKKIITSQGMVDLIENTVDYSIENQIVKIEEFKGIIETKDMSGSIEIQGGIEGELENPNYFIKLSNGNFGIKGFKFNNISLDLDGDKNQLELKEFLAYYEKNEIKGSGTYNFSSQKYAFDLFSNNIDLSFLNAIFSKDDVQNISGIANFDLKISSDLKDNFGYIDLENINFTIPKALITLKNFNMELGINDENLSVKGISGYLNNGKVAGKGYVKLPSIDEIKTNDEFYKELEYAFDLSLENFIYEMKNFFKIDLSTHLVYSENKVSGNIVVNKGEITGILKEDKGLIITILNFIIDKTRSLIGESKKLGKDFEIKNPIEQTPEFNVGVLIKDGIDINIPDISTFAQDVQGKLLGRFNVVGKNEKIAAIGELEIQKGKFVLGSEDFTVTRALLLSDKRNGYLADFNPNLIFDVSSMSSSGNIEISLQGELNSLRLNIITNQGTQSSSLKNLFDGNTGENGNERNVVALLFKTIIDSQISSTLLRPISRTIKDTLHISKFRIVSDIFNQEVLANSEDPKMQDPNMFGFGAYLEAENPIYKDKYFWILKLGIIDGTKYDIGGDGGENQQGEFSNSVNQFDFKIERRYQSGWSYGTGVSKLNEANMVDNKKKGNLNYYVDFKFEKKYNSIKDIFSNKK